MLTRLLGRAASSCQDGSCGCVMGGGPRQTHARAAFVCLACIRLCSGTGRMGALSTGTRARRALWRTASSLRDARRCGTGLRSCCTGTGSSGWRGQPSQVCGVERGKSYPAPVNVQTPAGEPTPSSQRSCCRGLRSQRQGRSAKALGAGDR